MYTADQLTQHVQLVYLWQALLSPDTVETKSHRMEALQLGSHVGLGGWSLYLYLKQHNACK